MRFDKLSMKKGSDNLVFAKVKFTAENKSQLPISLTRIQMFVNNTYFDCELLPQVIEEYVRKNNKEVLDRYNVASIHTPINLPALSAVSGYFVFLIPQDSLSENDKYLTFRICTSRGKAVQKTFELSQDSQIH